MSSVTDSPVLEATTPVVTGGEKIDAMAAVPKVEVEGFTIHSFSGMRKAFLQMTTNELENSEDHCRKYVNDKGLPENDLKDPNKAWDIMSAAIPDFLFHLTAAAFIATATSVDLSKLIGQPKESFREKVLDWWETLTDDQWSTLTIRGFQELIESNIGNDFKEKDEPGSAPTPNS